MKTLSRQIGVAVMLDKSGHETEPKPSSHPNAFVATDEVDEFGSERIDHFADIHDEALRLRETVG